jgi:sulfate transport system permease protein
VSEAHAQPLASGGPADRAASRGRGVRALLVGIALLYVLVLIVAPLGGIIFYGLRSGLGAITDTFSQQDVVHAFYLTFVIMLIAVAVTPFSGSLSRSCSRVTVFEGRASSRRLSTSRSRCRPSLSA